MNKYKEFEKNIKDAKSILIVSHVNPDGDTLGSMCALNSAIYKNFRKKSEMLVLSKIPQNYMFLPNVKEAKTLDGIDKSREYDLVITVDVASLDRILDAQVLFGKAKKTVNFDHHITNNNYGDLAIVEGSASSTGEVIYETLKALNWEFDYDTTLGIYTAILTDTGGFRFENTRANVFKIAADLTEKGINPKDVYKKCYETKTKETVLFQNYCVSKAEFSNNNKIAHVIIYKKDLEKFNAGDDATDGIAETLRSIITTEVSFVVKEVDTKICKVSMRSKNVDVSKVCESFGGGGHKFAAGCTVKMSCEDAAKAILSEINKGI